MKLLQTAAISALLLAGCAPYQHGHFARDASFVSKGGEAPGTPVLINTKVDPYYNAAVTGGHKVHHGPPVQHASHGVVDSCGVSFGCAVPASYAEPVFSAPVHSAPPIYSAPVHLETVHSAPVHGPTIHVDQGIHHAPPAYPVEVAHNYAPAPVVHQYQDVQPANLLPPPLHRVESNIHLQQASIPYSQPPIVAASTVSAPPEVIRMPTVYAPPEVINMPPVYLRAQGIQAQPFPDPPYPGQQAFAGGFPPNAGHQFGPPPPPYGPQPANARCVTSCGGTTY